MAQDEDTRHGSAERRWREDLAAWAIPQHILDAAPESPWHFPVELFARRADAAQSRMTASTLRALEALPMDGSVLDVGCGAGAASLPLAAKTSGLIGVDPSAAMLKEFRVRAQAAGVEVQTVRGAWPEAAARTPAVDVVVCHHVAYNAPGLAAFADRLSDHARRRVVLELTAGHPLSTTNDLWIRFHGLARPERPTADDAHAVLREAGLDPGREEWTPARGVGFAERRDLVAWVRRRLCLGPERDAEVEAALAGRIRVGDDGTVGFDPQPVVTFWWDGGAA